MRMPVPNTSGLRALTMAAAILCAAAPAWAQDFETSVPYAFLIDAGTDTILLDKNADELMPPASMAKLMTMAVVFNELKAGRLSLDDEFTISENAWRNGGANSGGSTMFAKLNSRVKLSDLIRGVIIQSGNDASIAIAEGVAGSEDAFARMMNARAAEIGMANSTFRNATGLPHPEQRVTARDLARLAEHIIKEYPEFYPIYSQTEFEWNGIRQSNRNPLLSLGINADGLKTGYTDESGYGLVGSAVEDGQRLIVVINGAQTANERASESRKILNWGFRAFEDHRLIAANDEVATARVYGGTAFSVPLVVQQDVAVLLPRGVAPEVSADVVYQGPVEAPVQAGQRIGTLRVTQNDTLALQVPLVAGADVPAGPIWRRAGDAVLELARGLF